MKKLNKLLYSNKFFCFIMLIIQIIVSVCMLKLSDYSQLLVACSTVIRAVLIIYEINRSGEATFKMTWVHCSMSLPVSAVFHTVWATTIRRQCVLTENILYKMNQL